MSSDFKILIIVQMSKASMEGGPGKTLDVSEEIKVQIFMKR